MTTYDLAIIGGGPAGYSAALTGGKTGARVCLIEKAELGGVCVNKGCIPTKAIRSSVVLFHKIKQASDHGIQISDCSIDYLQLLNRAQSVVSTIKQGVRQMLLVHKVEIINAEARLCSGNIIELGDKKINAKKVVVATGSRPKSLKDMAFDNNRILSPEAFLDLEELPQRVLIIGAGVNGCEWASILSLLGVAVTLIEAESQILPGEDHDLVKVLEKELKNKGVKIYPGYKITPDDEKLVQADKVMLCVGRQPLTAGLGDLQTTAQGSIKVNNHLQSNLSDVYAAGDVIGAPFLAYTAQVEGRVAAENALGKETIMDYGSIPKAIFSYPEIAAVGLTESQAKDRGYDVGVSRAYFKALGKALAEAGTAGLVKIVYDKSNYKLLGVGLVGDLAPELISEAALALARGLTVKEWSPILRPHPVFSEIFTMALEKIR